MIPFVKREDNELLKAAMTSTNPDWKCVGKQRHPTKAEMNRLFNDCKEDGYLYLDPSISPGDGIGLSMNDEYFQKMVVDENYRKKSIFFNLFED